MIKSILLSAFILCCSLSASDLFQPAAQWRTTSGAAGKYRSSAFAGIAKDSGASLVREFSSPADFSKLKYVKMEIVPAAGTKFIPGDLRLLFFSAKNKNSLARVAVYKDNTAYFYFSSPVPSDVHRLRFYFNARGRLNGQKVDFRIISITPVNDIPRIAATANTLHKIDFKELLPWNGGDLRNVKDASEKDGVIICVPENSGSYIRLNIAKGSAGKNVKLNRAEMSYTSDTEVTPDNFMLGLFGAKEKVYLRPVNKETGKLLFQISSFPDDLNGIRLYFNFQRNLSDKKLKLILSPLKFSQNIDKKVYKLEMPERKMVFDRTRIYPRIQSQYDLMLNYLDPSFKGTGTFYDRPLFFDRSLGETPLPIYHKLSSPAGFRKQLSTAQSFTDGLGLFGSARTPRFLRPIKFAEEGGFKDAVLLEFTPDAYAGNAFVNSKINIDAAMKNQAVLHHNGKLVLGSYAGDRRSAQWWKENIVNLRKTYGDKVLVMCEIRFICYSMARDYRKNGGFLFQSQIDNFKKRIRAYLEVADGINFSGSNHIGRNEKGYPEMVFYDKVYEDIIVPLMAQVLSEKAYNGKKLFGISAHKTYSQVRSTRGNIDEQGTRGLRRSVQIALAAGADYVVMPEWNEVNEYTHVEPVVSDARATERVVNAIRKRDVADVERIFPNLILSFRQENDLGFPIPVELLSLPDKKGRPFSATLKFYSPDGKLLKTFPTARFNAAEIEEVSFMEPALNYSSFRFIIPELTIVCDGKSQVIRDGLPHVRLTVPPNQHHRFVKIPLRDLPDPSKVDCELSIEGGFVRASGKVESADPIVTVELMANDIPIAAVDPANEYAPRKDGLILFSLVRQVAGNISYPTMPLKITALKGRIEARAPHQYSWSSVGVLKRQGDSLFASIAGGGGATKEALFYASEDAVLKIDCAGDIANVKISDILKYGRKRHVCFPGLNWRLAPVIELPEVPFPLNVKKLDFDLRAPFADRINPVYYMRFVTRSGRVYRSRPVMKEMKQSTTATVTLWDEMNSKAVKVAVPSSLAQQTEYCFVPELGDMLAPANRIVEYEAPAGGTDYRSHGTPHGWVYPDAPDWEKEDGRDILRFKKGDNLTIFTPVFTRAAFDIEMEVRFDDVKDQRFICGRDKTISVNVKDGIISSKLVSRTAVAELTATEKIVPGKWYNVRLVYDLEKYSILLDGRVIASAPLSGRLGHGWYISIGGGPFSESKLTGEALKKFKAKIADDGFNFTGSLRALKVK